MKDHKGLIVTMIIIIAPIVWFCVRVSTIKSQVNFTSGDYQDMEDTINKLSEEYISAQEAEYASRAAESGEKTGSKYGNPISKLITDAKINVASTNVYAEPDESSGVIGSAYKDVPITVQDYPDGWSMIKIDELSGWVKTEFITKPEEDISESTLGSVIGKNAKVIVSTLRVRGSAEINDNNIIDTLDEGDVVKIIGANDDETWLEVQYNTKSGWISGNTKYIKIVD